MGTATANASPNVANLDIGQGEDTLARLMALFAEHGDVFHIHSPELDRDLLVLSHPDHVRHVLVDHAASYHKGLGIERVAILLGKGLMTSEDALWRSQRKAVQPAFHRTEVARHCATIHAANAQLVTRWCDAATAGTPINVSHDVSVLTLEIVLRAIFSDAYPRLTQDANPFALLTVESERDLQFAYAFRQLAHLLQREIQQRRDGTEQCDDILQTLVDARDRRTGQAMPDRQIMDEVLTLIVAGHETTASALQWFWYLLGQHPSAAQALHAEALASAGPADNPAHFPLASAALAETMRLYPPGWLLTRRAVTEDRIGAHAITAGDDILISPYLVHRHPDFWTQPDRYQPERFESSLAQHRSRFCYLPFGLGPRACIGEPLALVEMLVHVVSVLRHLTLAPVDAAEIKPVAKVNLRPSRAVVMRATLRHRS